MINRIWLFMIFWIVLEFCVWIVVCRRVDEFLLSGVLRYLSVLSSWVVFVVKGWFLIDVIVIFWLLIFVG